MFDVCVLFVCFFWCERDHFGWVVWLTIFIYILNKLKILLIRNFCTRQSVKKLNGRIKCTPTNKLLVIFLKVFFMLFVHVGIENLM